MNDNDDLFQNIPWTEIVISEFDKELQKRWTNSVVDEIQHNSTNSNTTDT